MLSACPDRHTPSIVEVKGAGCARLTRQRAESAEPGNTHKVDWPIWRAGPSALTLLSRATALTQIWTTGRHKVPAE